MELSAQRIPYRQTNQFTPIVLDYIDQAETLRPFFRYTPGLKGVEEAIHQRKNRPVDRQLLVGQLRKQYAAVTPAKNVQQNIDWLLKENTFTVTTAHQPNILTGPLYFIYKIMHVIRLADQLNETYKGRHFVPVFCMGSEDADLNELGHLYIGGERLSWSTTQKGAVGRMIIDKKFIGLIERIRGELLVEPHGEEILALIGACYREGMKVQDATFEFLHALFGAYGLIVLIPDNPELKSKMYEVFRDDLLHQTASAAVEKTSAKLGQHYKVQVTPREINLFYLQEGLRGRIEKVQGDYIVHDSDLRFSEKEILEELEKHPERFSPNVVLRGIYQETILPNIIFIGGGGEIAYWLQLKDMFDHYRASYPVLVLRNSFLLIGKKQQDMIRKLGLQSEDFFGDENELMNQIVVRDSKHETRLNGNLTAAEKIYDEVKARAGSIDLTLTKHVEALKTQTLQRLRELEKKMLRAEKRKFADQRQQVHAIREALFPSGGLQERVDNFIPYYAAWGADFLKNIYQHSFSFEHEFVILAES